jgi:RNA polymerase sigma-70 factor, ECF subfamily
MTTAEAAQEVEWIKRCQQGDREAFAPLVERHRQSVFLQVYHLVRRRDEVEDIVQEIFIKAFTAIRSYNFQASFGTWLARIAVNHCYDYLRRGRSSRVSYYWQMSEEGQREIEAHLESPEPGGLNTEQRMVVADLAGKLLERAPADDRALLVLKEMEGRSVEEIAGIMNLNVSTVKVRLHRARKRMLKDLERWRRGR